MSEPTVRFSVSLPAGMLRTLDRHLAEGRYASRSEFVRDLIREKMVEMVWREGAAEAVGVLTLVYDHREKRVPARLLEVQHHHHVRVVCSTHVHLDRIHCLEVLILRGRPVEIQRLAVRIRGIKGVAYAHLTRAAPPR